MMVTVVDGPSFIAGAVSIRYQSNYTCIQKGLAIRTSHQNQLKKIKCRKIPSRQARRVHEKLIVLLEAWLIRCAHKESILCVQNRTS